MSDLTVKGLVKSATAIYGNTPQAALAVTQAVLESRLQSGKPSGLARDAYNLFGIKGQGDAGSVNMPTTEYYGGSPTRVNADFAKYKNYESSFQAHKNLMQKPRYSSVWQAKDPYEAFDAVKQSGYATDPHYPRLLSNIYNKYVKPYFNWENQE